MPRMWTHLRRHEHHSRTGHPCGLPCVECGELAVKRDVPLTTMGADATLNADKATGGQWSELVDKMAKSTPKRYDNLERSKSFGGGKLGPR